MHYELNIKGKPFCIEHPLVMGILNCTPDSFFAESRKQTEQDIVERTNRIIDERGAIIDVGGMSTRPGGTFITEEEEKQRLRFALPIVAETIARHPALSPQHLTPNTQHPLISVDTFRPMVAKMAVEEFGVDIVNDVGAPENQALHTLETVSREEMYRTVAQLHVPYILMSNQPIVDDIILWLGNEIKKLCSFGVNDVIVDPGYGFGKTIEQNFDLLRNQQQIVDTLCLPLLAGVSRKRMIWQTLGTSPDEALNGTTVLNTLALERGAAILRVHDVREAVECVKLINMF